MRSNVTNADKGEIKMAATTYLTLQALSLRELYEKARDMGLTVRGKTLRQDADIKGYKTKDEARIGYINRILRRIKTNNEIRRIAWNSDNFANLRGLWERNYLQ